MTILSKVLEMLHGKRRSDMTAMVKRRGAFLRLFVANMSAELIYAFCMILRIRSYYCAMIQKPVLSVIR
jgi:hypothetical protein